MHSFLLENSPVAPRALAPAFSLTSLTSSSSAPSALPRLREATATLHRQLDGQSRMAQLMSPKLTLEEYAGTVQAMQRIYAPLERALALAQSQSGAALLWQPKTHLLVSDLHVLGYAPSPSESHFHSASQAVLPDMHSASQIAGVLYVLEGACLGGQVIRKRLLSHWGPEAQTYTHFFAGHDEGVARHWARVCQQLEDLLANHAGENAAAATASACASARQTFMLFIAELAGPPANPAP